MGLCALSRWREGRRYESKARFELGIRPHLGTDHLTSSPKIRVGGRLEKQNSLYILIGSGGESVSQSPLKDQAFSIFLDQNPPFELPPENGISPYISLSRPMAVIDNSAIKRLAKGKLPSHRSA
jgi:hypothetical protein